MPGNWGSSILKRGSTSNLRRLYLRICAKSLLASEEIMLKQTLGNWVGWAEKRGAVAQTCFNVVAPFMGHDLGVSASPEAEMLTGNSCFLM